MGALFLWLSTTAASIFMELTNECRMFKDAADNGYKINIDRLSKLQKELGIDSKKGIFELFLPIINIIGVLKRTMEYNEIRPMALDVLDTIDALDEMTELEKEAYTKKPTLFNALGISIKSSINVLSATKVTIKDDNGVSEVYFDIDHATKKIIIYKASGYISELKYEEQKKYLLEHLMKVSEAAAREREELIETFKQIGNSNKEIKSTIDARDNYNKEENLSSSVVDKTTSEQIDDLKNFKEELLQSKDDGTTFTNNDGKN